MNIYHPRERKFTAYLDRLQLITVLLPKTYQNGYSAAFFLEGEAGRNRLKIEEMIDLGTQVKYVCLSSFEPEIGKLYWVFDEHGEKTDLQIGAVIRSEEFDRKYYYDGPLGMTYSPEETVFRVWTPTALAVLVNLYRPDGMKELVLSLNRQERGVWEKAVKGDYENYFYTFSVCVNFSWQEAVDPYAVAVSVNGERGAIVDLEKTAVVKISPPPLTSDTDAIIYETHLRDFTIHPNSGVQQKGMYLGAAETDTKTSCGLATGLSYVQKLGVTHIEFLPWNDFAGVDELGSKQDYNWGYNPLNYNAPEGSYSLDPSDPYARIIELKTMIQRLHSKGLRVIMDVVYNHVYIREKSAFEKIVPGYYFRHDQYGHPSNGTGVGNDFASERLMARKFILDSVKFWKEEYDVDGFRFDLMGIIDVETMNSVRSLLDRYDSHTLVLGEGWDLNTPLPPQLKANMRNQDRLPGIGHFNDFFRDTVKGSTFNLLEKGYALGNHGNVERMKQALVGSIAMTSGEKGLFLHPTQSINYVESHDNHTFWDKMEICLRSENLETRKKRQRLATVMTLLAQGIPFIHSGQEFFRTKKGNGNSYQAPDEINQLDWDEMVKNIAHVNYIKGIIAIRKSHRAFRFPDADLVRRHMSFLEGEGPALAYMLDDVSPFGPWKRIIVAFNSSGGEISLSVPGDDWFVLADEHKAGTVPLRLHREKIFRLSPYSSYVLVSE